MPQTRSNGVQTPVNADTFNLTGDLATMAESITSIVSVLNQSAGDSIATSRAASGFPISDAKPLFIYNQTTKTIQVKDSSGWRDMNGPLGLVYYNQVTTATGAMGSLTIVYNIATFTFIANRRYRIVWDFSHLVTGQGGLFYTKISSCSTSDGPAVTTGLTVLSGRTKGIVVANSTTHTGAVTAQFKSATTVTVQIKFSAERVAGTTETMTIVGNGTGEPADYMIYDDGMVI